MSDRRTTWLSVLLFAGVMLLYARVRNYDFVSYDDPDYVTENAYVQKGLTTEGLAWAFGRLHGDRTYWHPLTWVSHMLDCQLFGLQAGWHHLMNVLLHAVNSVLVFAVLRQLTGTLWRSWMVAAIFAVHPLQVDTVAWVTERKNVLSTMFWLLTLLAYTAYVRRSSTLHAPRSRLRQGFGGQANEAASSSVQRGKEGSTINAQLSPLRAKGGWYALALALFALGLMSKPMLVTLPCVMLLLDYWPLKRIDFKSGWLARSSRLLLEKVPFLVLAAISSWITVQGHAGLGMTQAVHGVPLLLRLEHAVVAYGNYLAKAVWPTDLAVLYPHPGEWPEERVALSGLALAAITVLVVWNGRRRPFLPVGWLWFLGVLVPTIGIVQIGVQAMADRFAYVPLIGLGIIIAWGGAGWLTKLQAGLTVKVMVAALTLGALSIVSANQLPHWRNSMALYEHAVKVTENNYVMLNNLGYTLMQSGRVDEAMQQFQEAVRLKPDFAEAVYQLGTAQAAKGRVDEALASYQRASHLRPDWLRPRKARAEALAQAGRSEEAIQEYERLVRQYTRDDLHATLGLLLSQQQRTREAVAHYREALRLYPDSVPVLNNLAWVLATDPNAEIRNGNEAVNLAERACALTQRKEAQYLGTLAAAFAEASRFTEAIQTGEEAVARATAAGNRQLAEANRKFVDLYRTGTPFREAR